MHCVGVLGMASDYRIEYDRGTKEAAQQLAVLREKWPLAFPVNEQDDCLPPFRPFDCAISIRTNKEHFNKNHVSSCHLESCSEWGKWPIKQ